MRLVPHARWLSAPASTARRARPRQHPQLHRHAAREQSRLALPEIHAADGRYRTGCERPDRFSEYASESAHASRTKALVDRAKVRNREEQIVSILRAEDQGPRSSFKDFVVWQRAVELSWRSTSSQRAFHLPSDSVYPTNCDGLPSPSQAILPRDLVERPKANMFSFLEAHVDQIAKCSRKL